jgi:hypothetical protein
MGNVQVYEPLILGKEGTYVYPLMKEEGFFWER